MVGLSVDSQLVYRWLWLFYGQQDSLRREKINFSRKLWKQQFFPHDLAPTARNSKGADELWSGKTNKWKGKYLIQFGRVGWVTIKSERVGKLENKSEPMIMVGYAKEYPVGTYQFYNPKTKWIIVSDSVQWTDFSRWKITPELNDIFDVVKRNNQTGLESYDELGLEDVLKQHMRFRLSIYSTNYQT